jgi:aspartate kinase
VEFAKDKGIAIYARATASPLPGPDPSADGTVVRQTAASRAGTVVGVASEKDLLIVDVDGPAADVLQALDAHKVAPRSLHSMTDRLLIIVSRENLHEEARVRADLAQRFGARVRIVDNLAAATAVGTGITASFELLRRGSDALQAAGITPASVDTSSLRITWMVPRARLDEAVRVLHRALIETA